MRLGRLLYRLPEIHAVTLVAIGGFGLAFVPQAEVAGLVQVTSCGWHSWVGTPQVTCPGDTIGETLYTAALNLPSYPLGAFAAAFYAATSEATNWADLLQPRFITGFLQIFLVVVLLWRGLRWCLRRLRG
ncbi:MAG: hypothetical protein AAGA70_10370 [Pseudomonadota bacterium]